MKMHVSYSVVFEVRIIIIWATGLEVMHEFL